MMLPVSLLFSQHWTKFGSNFAPQDHTQFDFCCWFLSCVTYILLTELTDDPEQIVPSCFYSAISARLEVIH